MGRLRVAVLQAGFSDAAAEAVAAGPDATGVVDTLLGALVTQRCALVVDDTHHAAPDASALLERIASHLVGDQRLVVLARKLPQGGSACDGPSTSPQPGRPVIEEDQSSMSESRKRIPPVAAWASPPASSPAAGDASAAHAVA